MKEKILALRNDGLNCTQIGFLIGLHRTTVSKILRANGIDTSKSSLHRECVICGRSDNKHNRICNSCKTKIRRYRTKRAAINYLGGRCFKCGWFGNHAAFEFHHISEDKEFNISAVANRSWSVVITELNKCELLCSNCHRIEHSTRHNDEKFLNEVAKYNGTILRTDGRGG